MQSIQMNQKQQGFTLIELMIVVAIIGILAAIAVPQYQSYIARSQFSEPPTLMSAAKTAVEERFLTTGTFETDPSDLGIKEEGEYGKISGISSSGSGDDATVTITYTFASSGVNSDLSGETVSFKRTTSGDWTCNLGSPDKMAPYATGECVPSS